ncbi:hypothetical protein [Actinotalea sp.]|uniref:hypothetical protein n=1 Tax=Actinotalea sp. TaxID=1872145 RepID=UPI0035619FF7
MTEVTIAPAILGLVGVLTVGVLSLVGVLIGQLWSRMASLEKRVSASAEYNRRLWLWARKHIDLYYRHRAVGAPDPDPIPEDHDD